MGSHRVMHIKKEDFVFEWIRANLGRTGVITDQVSVRTNEWQDSSASTHSGNHKGDDMTVLRFQLFNGLQISKSQ